MKACSFISIFIFLFYSNKSDAQVKLSKQEIQKLIDVDFIFTEVDTFASMKHNGGCYVHASINDNSFIGKYDVFLTILKTGVLSKIEIRNDKNIIVKDTTLVNFFEAVYYKEFKYSPASVLGQNVSSILTFSINIINGKDEFDD